jgi:acyl carrier protein
MDEIFEKLKQIIKEILPEIDIEQKNITIDSDIKEDLGLNSIGMLYLVLAIEKEFGIEFKSLTVDSFKTIRDVCIYIENN